MKPRLEEEWRPWDVGDYEVSNHGRVRRRAKGRGTTPGRLLKPHFRAGALYVTIFEGGLKKDGTPIARVHYRVATMVAELFIGPRPRGEHALHLDGKPRNCAAWNLVWGPRTPRKLNARQLANFRAAVARGAEHYCAKLNDEKVLELRVQHHVHGKTVRELAQAAGLNIATMFNALSGKTWKHVPMPNHAHKGNNE